MGLTEIAVKCRSLILAKNLRAYRLLAMVSDYSKLPVHYLDMVGVTGSIPVAPTTQSSCLVLCGDVRRWSAIGRTFLFHWAVSPFLSAY